MIDRALAASLLAAIAAPCAAQYYEPAWSPPYPAYGYAPPRQPYRYPPDYRYARPYRNDRYENEGAYRPARPWRDEQAYRPAYGYGYQRPTSPAQYQPRDWGSQDPYSTAPQVQPQAAYQPQPQPAYQPRPQTAYQPRPDYRPQAVDPATQDGQGRLLSPGQDGSKDLASAASAPLHDLNLTRQTIPPVLMAALADPYAAPPATDCPTLAAAVDELTVALGPDYDTPRPSQSKGVADSGGLGLALVHGAAASLLPYDGLVKHLTGASQHDEKIIRALAAGGARRAYLKGLGEDRHCADGASPRHQIGPAAAREDDRWRPKYPIWWDRAG
ncbi:MAG TPA: hypothetical protein VG166_02465 [Caulobacteraceae bacterium]|nr:hypothetical protein [Caulobacteraceae bacterium]